MTTYFIGDIHGQRAALERLLQQNHLVDRQLHWTGADATLWFLGDFVDRGPDGVGAIELVMRLQHEAALAGGAVHALLGNHEVLLLAAYHFRDHSTLGPDGTFISDWLGAGGNPDDLARLQPYHVEWITHLPAMALWGDTLLAHADALFYTRYGKSLKAVNYGFRELLTSHDPVMWDRSLEDFSERLRFVQEDGDAALDYLFATYGGNRLIHGHTPICYVARKDPASVREPLVYGNGRCINIDGGLFLGGLGFVYRE